MNNENTLSDKAHEIKLALRIFFYSIVLLGLTSGLLMRCIDGYIPLVKGGLRSIILYESLFLLSILIISEISNRILISLFIIVLSTGIFLTIYFEYRIAPSVIVSVYFLSLYFLEKKRTES